MHKGPQRAAWQGSSEGRAGLLVGRGRRYASLPLFCYLSAMLRPIRHKRTHVAPRTCTHSALSAPAHQVGTLSIFLHFFAKPSRTPSR